MLQPTPTTDWQQQHQQYEAQLAQPHTQMDSGQQVAQWTPAEANPNQIDPSQMQQQQQWAQYHEQQQWQLQQQPWQLQQHSFQHQPSSADFQHQPYAPPTQQPDESVQTAWSSQFPSAHPSSLQERDAWQPVAPQPHEQLPWHSAAAAAPDASSFDSADLSTPSRQPHPEASSYEAQQTDANASANASVMLPHHRRMASPATSLLCSKLERALTDRPTIAALMQKNVLHSNPSDAAAVSRSIDRLARALHTEKEQRAEVRQQLKSKLRARPSLDLLIRQHIWPQFQDDPQQTLDLTPVSSATHVRHRSMANDATAHSSDSLSFAQQLDAVGVLPAIDEQSSVSPLDTQLQSPHTIAAGSSTSSPADAARAATGSAAAASSTTDASLATDPVQLSQGHLNAVRSAFLDQLLTRFALQQQSHARVTTGAADVAQSHDLHALLEQVRQMNRGE